LFYLINRFDPYEGQSGGTSTDDNGPSGVLGSLWFVCGGLTLQGTVADEARFIRHSSLKMVANTEAATSPPEREPK
jgi:hypothetical protein